MRLVKTENITPRYAAPNAAAFFVPVVTPITSSIKSYRMSETVMKQVIDEQGEK
jgi:hypothetical protein